MCTRPEAGVSADKPALVTLGKVRRQGAELNDCRYHGKCTRARAAEGGSTETDEKKKKEKKRRGLSRRAAAGGKKHRRRPCSLSEFGSLECGAENGN